MNLINQMDDINIKLIVFREVLRYKAIIHDEIVSWADSIISLSDSPPEYIIDLSLSKNSHEAISIISEQCNNLGFPELKNHPKNHSICKQIFRYLSKALSENRLSPEVVSKILFDLAMDDIEPSEGVNGEMFYYWDGLDLVKDGVIGDYNKIVNDMKKLLEVYGE